MDRIFTSIEVSVDVDRSPNRWKAVCRGRLPEPFSALMTSQRAVPQGDSNLGTQEALIVPRIEPRMLSAQQALVRDNEALKTSHSVLLSRLSEVSAAVDTIHQSVAEISRSSLRDTQVRDQFALRRIRIFASLHVTRALTGPCRELSKTYRALCAANTVRPILLKSKAMDCTLHDFRVLATSCVQDPTVSCCLLPSQYYAMLYTPNRACRFQIMFESFKDFCNALQIDVSTREDAVYREKRTSSRQLRAIQVLGVTRTVPLDGNNTQVERFVFLGRSFSDEFDLSSCQTLVQPNAVWTDCSWESGFSLDSNICAEKLEKLESECSKLVPSNVATSKSSCEDSRREAFTLTWERSDDRAASPSQSSEEVCGILRANIPAVILRSVLLTSTVQRVFSTQIDDVYLKQLLTSTQENNLRDISFS